MSAFFACIWQRASILYGISRQQQLHDPSHSLTDSRHYPLSCVLLQSCQSKLYNRSLILPSVNWAYFRKHLLTVS